MEIASWSIAVNERVQSSTITLGVQGLVKTSDNQVLLVRHSYRRGWHFPGGGVEIGETAKQALVRELAEEAGIEPTADPKLFGIFAHFDAFPGDHIALYVIEAFRHAPARRSLFEIAGVSFFRMDSLPQDINPGAARRIYEFINEAPSAPDW